MTTVQQMKASKEARVANVFIPQQRKPGGTFQPDPRTARDNLRAGMAPPRVDAGNRASDHHRQTLHDLRNFGEAVGVRAAWQAHMDGKMTHAQWMANWADVQNTINVAKTNRQKDPTAGSFFDHLMAVHTEKRQKEAEAKKAKAKKGAKKK